MKIYFFVGISAMAAVLVVITSNSRLSGTRPTVLFTAPHAEFAPFQRVWNPDTNNQHSQDEFPERNDDGLITDTLCGKDGSLCPQLPSFGGESYFDNKPLDCCHTEQQQQIWNKWKDLKNRIAKMEGVYTALKIKKNSVDIKHRYISNVAAPGKRGPMGPAGPQGLGGSAFASKKSIAVQGLHLEPQIVPSSHSSEETSMVQEMESLKKEVEKEWAAIRQLQARLPATSKTTSPSLASPSTQDVAPAISAVSSIAAKKPASSQIGLATKVTSVATAKPAAVAPAPGAAKDNRLVQDEQRLAADMAAVAADESRLGIRAPAAAATAVVSPVQPLPAAAVPQDANLEMGTLGSVPAVPLTGELGRDEPTPAASATVAASGAAQVAGMLGLSATAPAVPAAAAGVGANGEPLDDLPPLGSFDLARFANNIESGGGDLGTNVVWMYKDLAKKGHYRSVEELDGEDGVGDRKYGYEYATGQRGGVRRAARAAPNSFSERVARREYARLRSHRNNGPLSI